MYSVRVVDEGDSVRTSGSPTVRVRGHLFSIICSVLLCCAPHHAVSPLCTSSNSLTLTFSQPINFFFHFLELLPISAPGTLGARRSTHAQGVVSSTQVRIHQRNYDILIHIVRFVCSYGNRMETFTPFTPTPTVGSFQFLEVNTCSLSDPHKQ